MTKDELADYLKVGLDELHAHIDAEPEGQRKRRANRLAKIAHHALDELKELAQGDGLIQPLSGGEEKPPSP